MIRAANPRTDTSTTAETLNMSYVLSISIVAALGGLLFGYDWVVIGGAKPFYEKFFHLSEPSLQGWAMSCALVGCLIGAIISGGLSDRFGRKHPLIISAFLFAASSLGTGLASNFAVFVAWRITGGLAIGLASSLSPMYIAEVAPAQVRGKLVSLNQLTIVIGILAAQLVNWLIAQPVPANATAQQILVSWNGQVGWRWMFGVTAIPSVIFFAAMFLVPESPRWLVKNRSADVARDIFARIGGEAHASAELAEVKATLSKASEKVNFRELFDLNVRGALVLGVALAVLQQWCGINVIFNYAEEVFSAAGYNVSDILFNIVITGAVNLVFTLIAIGTVDKRGRRPLMLIGSAGLAVIYTVLGALYHANSHGVHMLVLVVLAIGCYGMSLAPLTWVVISEIFPNRVRGAAMSVAVTALWIACFVLTYTFPLLNKNLGAARTFWIYAAICAAGFVFIKLRLPETKGRSLEEIEQIWGKRD